MSAQVLTRIFHEIIIRFVEIFYQYNLSHHCINGLEVGKMSPLGRINFISSAAFQADCGKVLQQQTLCLAAKAKLISGISGLN